MLFDVNDLDDSPVVRKVTKTVQPEKFVPEKMVKMHRELAFPKDDFFNEEKFPHGFVFYDFEVFLYDWMVVLIDPINFTKDIVVNDREALITYYYKHQQMIWVGYNSNHYDVPILKGIILRQNPKEISDAIIVEGKSPWEINKDFNKIKLLSYDCSDGVNSLKVLEAYIGDDIEETDVPFDILRQLTMEEIRQTMKYCIHDVEETIEVFKRRINDFNASISIIEMFDLPIENICKTKGQLTALVVGCERKEHDDEFDIKILPCIQLEKYKHVQDWFLQAAENKDYKAKLETMVCGVPHLFGWGGVHGAPDKPIHISIRSKDE